MNYGGYLTLQSGSPKITADQTSSTLWYCPDKSGVVTVGGNDVSFLSGPSDQLGWSVSVAGMAIGQYHVFASSFGLVLGSAWNGAPPQSFLTRINGQLVDAATGNAWLGSINVSVAGQLTCHVSEDCNRKFEVYNAHNQREIGLCVITKERDLQYCPVNQYPKWQPFNNDTQNCGTVFTGAPELVDVVYAQQVFLNSDAGSYGILNAVGWNGSAAGKWGGGTQDDVHFAGGLTNVARYMNPGALGVNVASMLISAAVNSASRASTVVSAADGVNWPYNPDANGLMTIRWRG